MTFFHTYSTDVTNYDSFWQGKGKPPLTSTPFKTPPESLPQPSDISVTSKMFEINSRTPSPQIPVNVHSEGHQSQALVSMRRTGAGPPSEPSSSDWSSDSPSE